jgi:hypothetical protein
MEITIKTADEFRDSHVTINVTAADSNKAGRVVTRLIGSRLYTAEEVGEAQYGEAELVAAPLRKKIAELEGQLAQSRELVTFKTGVIDALQGDVEKFEANTDRKIAELEADIHRRQMASTSSTTRSTSWRRTSPAGSRTPGGSSPSWLPLSRLGRSRRSAPKRTGSGHSGSRRPLTGR